MHIIRRAKSPLQLPTVGLVVMVMMVLGMASCRSPHSPTRRTETNLDPGWPKGNSFFHQASFRKLQVTVPEIAGAEFVDDDELCLSCHETYTKTFAQNVHGGHSCEACHGPASRHLETRGKEPGLLYDFKKADPTIAAELCLRCHENNACEPGARWRTSVHAHNSVTCTDCHTSHYNVPPGTPATVEEEGESAARFPYHLQAALLGKSGQDSHRVTLAQYEQREGWRSLKGTSNNMGAVDPYVCYQCHCDMRDMQEIASPHQICGSNGFNCTTCHDPHGKIREESRKDLCLSCHQNGSPTMAWHSSTHDMNGVACTDCHNPHPRACVPQVVSVSHTEVRRPKRIPMSVDEPRTCFKCHPKIFGLNGLPSHHPIKEGRMVCSDCHDGHGQLEGNLKADSVNLLCAKCHAEKQGPFVFEHAPASENCAICHEPHGTVTNNLLRQPTTFLCLRCHAGHRERVLQVGPRLSTNYDIDGNTGIQPGFYKDCTQCHAQVHGSDMHGLVPGGTFMR